MKRWLLALAFFGGIAVAQNLISGGSANPQTGPATLTSLTVGTIDAGAILNPGTASLGNGCFTSGSSANTLACATSTSTNVGITMGSNGILNGANGFISAGVGSFGTPQFYFAGDTNTGLYWVGADQMGVTTGGARSFNFNATAGTLEGVTSTPKLVLDNSSGSCLNYTGASLCVANSTIGVSSPVLNFSSAASEFRFGSKALVINSTPTISSGFGTSPSVSAGTNSASFRIDVGTGGAATTGVIGLPTATTGWNCFCSDITTTTATVDVCKQIGSGNTTTVTIGNFTSAGIAGAWVASDILIVHCFGY